MIALRLLAAALVLGVGVPFVISLVRFRSAWHVLTARYPPTERESPLKPADRVGNTYCEVHALERNAAGPGFTIDVTPRGFAMVPGRWRGPLAALWIPWPAVSGCELTTRIVGRLVVHCVRLTLAEANGWVLVDSPAGQRLYRSWRSA
jgi:hypothetical protein